MTLWACIYDPNAEAWIRYPHRIERLAVDDAGVKRLVYDETGTLAEARQFCETQASHYAQPENGGEARQWVVLDTDGTQLADDGDGYTPPLNHDAAAVPRAVTDALKGRA